MAKFRIAKQTLWRWHSVCGLVAGLGLLVIGLTGSVLVFSREIDGLLRPEVVRVDPPPGAVRLPLDELVGRVATAFPGHPLMGWAFFHDDPAASDRVWVKLTGDDEPWLYVHLDPYTGRILSRPAESGDGIVGWLLELHYSLLADHLGMLLAGLFGVMLGLLGVSGLWLYRDFFRNFLRLRWKSSARILFSDLHKFVGINSVLFNLILGFTGGWWNLSHLLGHLVEEEPTKEQAAPAPAPRQWSSLAPLLAKAEGPIDGFTAHYISFPGSEGDPLTFYGQHGGAGPFRGLYGSSVAFDPLTGEIRESKDLREASLWGQIYDSFMPLHYGTFGGWPIRLLWCLGGLAPGALAISGFFIWRSRRGARRRSSHRETGPDAASVPPSRRARRDEAART